MVFLLQGDWLVKMIIRFSHYLLGSAGVFITTHVKNLLTWESNILNGLIKEVASSPAQFLRNPSVPEGMSLVSIALIN